MPVRLLTALDLPAILAIQRACYPDGLQEGLPAYRRKLAKFPAGCLGLDRSGEVGGYLFCQPWLSGLPLPLDDPAESLPPEPDCLYVHDLAVLPAWRGGGAAAELVAAVFRLAAARGFSRFALTAVQGSEPFWARWGFRVVRRFDYAPGLPASAMVREDALRGPGLLGQDGSGGPPHDVAAS